MTLVKICGVTNIEDARLCIDAGIDFIGLVLSDSPRRAGYDAVGRILAEAAGKCHVVGVFAKTDDLLRFDHMTDFVLDYCQIYFAPPANLRRVPTRGWIHSTLVTETIAAATLCNGDLHLLDFKNLHVADMLRCLADQNAPLPRRALLGGNLSADNVAAVIKTHRPFGVDVARGTERLPGIKDHDLVIAFMETVRNADRSS